MVSKKIFLNPNNTFTESVSKFWLAFTNCMKNGEFFDYVPEEYKTITGTGLNEKWGSTYIEYLGKAIPFNIAILGDAKWDEIEEFICLVYDYVVLEDKRSLFEKKINEYLGRFDIKFLFLKGQFITADFVANQPTVTEVLEWIDLYPDAAKAYRAALKKLSNKEDTRNAIDDMRLALESLIRDIMGTTKTLENQIQPIGSALKNKGVLPQAVILVTTMLNHYAKYQNDNVKHHDTVDVNDSELIVNMTAIIMKYIRDRLG